MRGMADENGELIKTPEEMQIQMQINAQKQRY